MLLTELYTLFYQVLDRLNWTQSQLFSRRFTVNLVEVAKNVREELDKTKGLVYSMESKAQSWKRFKPGREINDVLSLLSGLLVDVDLAQKNLKKIMERSKAPILAQAVLIENIEPARRKLLAVNEKLLPLTDIILRRKA